MSVVLKVLKVRVFNEGLINIPLWTSEMVGEGQGVGGGDAPSCAGHFLIGGVKRGTSW